MIPGLNNLPYEARIGRLGLWTLEERRNRADLLYMFKMYKGLLPTPFSRFFKITTNSTIWGHSAKITKAHCELDIRRFFLFRKSYQQMEPTGPRSCWFRHCKFFQEQPRANQEIKDRLLHGSSGPLSLMATSDCFNQVHLVSYLVSI